MTTVVNIRREACDVYIGRAGRGCDGYFGNPFRVGSVALVRRDGHHVFAPVRHGEAVELYRAYFLERVRSDPEFRARVEQLRGKRLGCFCKPDACHGDVIVEYLTSVGSGAAPAGEPGT